MMLKRFYLLQDCNKKSMIDLKLKLNLGLNYEELKTLKNIVDALEPIKNRV